MKKGFYLKMAWSNLVRNRQFYVPNIITGAGLVACFYIVLTLSMDDRLHHVRGGNYIPTFMAIGLLVTAILSTILIIYTNSFIMKQRKREFGLINVLGMEKKHVGRLLLAESFISANLAILGGMMLGVVFYKLCTLIICKLVASEAVNGFYYIRAISIIPTIVFFTILFAFTYICNRIRIGRLKPVEMLKSANTGEKEPKIKFILLIIGILTLGGGYYYSVSTLSPLQAINNFLTAVLLVILGTYCLFVAGTIAVLKMLKKNKNYYYNKKHMPAVAGLLFRMKGNAVGLASITILATMVLVMMSCTISLYGGMEKTLYDNYPQHLYLKFGFEDSEGALHSVDETETERIIKETAQETGLEIEDVVSQYYLEATYLLLDNELCTDQKNNTDSSVTGHLASCMWVSQDYYNEIASEKVDLKDNEIAITKMNGDNDFTFKSLKMQDMELAVSKKLLYFPISSSMSHAVDCYGIVVSNGKILEKIYEIQKEAYGKNCSDYTSRTAAVFKDADETFKKGNDFDDILWTKMREYVDVKVQGGTIVASEDSIWEARENIYGLYGSLLFLGMLLGTVFSFTTALLIYYKQISEGYEDRERFQIMQKLGMSEKEVKKTINSQMLMVFLLPLIVAGIHMAFASPMLIRMLKIFMLPSVGLFIGCTVIVFVIFAIIYIMLYYMTAKTYMKIVY